MNLMRYGVDCLLARSPQWKKSPFALVTNSAAYTSSFEPTRAALLREGFALRKFFSPEHGLDVAGADGQAMRDGVDPLTGLPIISLYGEKLAPSVEDLSDVTHVLFDIPDVGSRFYTYLWTLTHVLESCAREGKKLIVLDRPNPLSGRFDLCEGPLLQEASLSSFVGRWTMPVRHSCTLGELASYFNAVRNIGCELEVIRCEGWKRSQFASEWSACFTPTSPAIANFEAALHYPGLCFFEATNLSVGRGSSLAFRVVGAPWLDAQQAVREWQRSFQEDVFATAVTFCSQEGSYAGQKCNGVMLYAPEPGMYRPVRAGLLLLYLLRRLHSESFAWAAYPTNVNPTGAHHLDLLTGILQSESWFDLSQADFLAMLDKHLSVEGWAEEMSSHTCYEYRQQGSLPLFRRKP